MTSSRTLCAWLQPKMPLIDGAYYCCSPLFQSWFSYLECLQWHSQQSVGHTMSTKFLHISPTELWLKLSQLFFDVTWPLASSRGWRLTGLGSESTCILSSVSVKSGSFMSLSTLCFHLPFVCSEAWGVWSPWRNSVYSLTSSETSIWVAAIVQVNTHG